MNTNNEMIKKLIKTTTDYKHLLIPSFSENVFIYVFLFFFAKNQFL